MQTVELVPTRCAICSTEDNATELYPANLDFEAFNPAVFSARRLPDRLHYRMVKCRTCGLVRSDPVVTNELLSQLYARSTFTYRDEVADLRRTYGRYLAGLDRHGVRKEALLEIGCGNGFFLEEALDQGYRTVQGVEPSQAAIDEASPRVRDSVVCDVMRPGLFHPAQFDVVCLFQVFDHIPDPAALLYECFRLLRPGGLVLCINHNVEALSSRLLGERSPIIDVEHTYLYSPRTMEKLFEKHGFNLLRQGPVWNTYNLSYLTWLMPLPESVKHRLLSLVTDRPLGDIRLLAPLGNLFLVAQVPETSPLAEGANE